MKLAHALLAAILAVFAPVGPAALTVLTLVACDFVFGVQASRTKGAPFQSAVARRTAVKLAVYEAALLLGFLVETYLVGSSVPVSKIVAAFIGLTEFSSILENLNAISGTNLLKSLVTKLGAPKE